MRKFNSFRAPIDNYFGPLNFTMKIFECIVRNYTASVRLVTEEFCSLVQLLDFLLYPQESTAMKTKNGVTELRRRCAHSSVHCTCTHGQNFPSGFLGPGNLDPRLHTGSRFSFRVTTLQHLTVPSGVPFVFDEDENRENKKS